MPDTVNPKSCPFCNGVNSCMAKDKNPCWCNNIVIPVELTAIVPIQLQRKSCICLACINLFNENPEHFKDKYLSAHISANLIDIQK